jgi:hypothetical protein
MNLPRYFFNQSNRQCEEFSYTGCSGNLNNFQSLDECIVFCRPLTPNSRDPLQICAQPKVVGPCRAAWQRFYFNTTHGRCERFTYGGCDGNQNNFDSEIDCEQTCLTSIRAVNPINGSANPPPQSEPVVAHRPVVSSISHYPTPELSSQPSPSPPPSSVALLPDMFADPLDQVDELNKRVLQQASLPVAFPYPPLHLRPSTHFLSTSQYMYADVPISKTPTVRTANVYRGKTSAMISRNKSPIQKHSPPLPESQQDTSDPNLSGKSEVTDNENPGFFERRTTSTVRRPAQSYAIFQMGKSMTLASPNCRDRKDAGHACDQLQVRFWFNQDTQLCEQFRFYGCAGNGNNFAFAQDCLTFCNAKGLNVNGVVFRRSN